MRAILIALAFVAVGLSGCANEPVQETEAEIFNEPIEVKDDKGVIRGIVVDDTISPIEGAKIKGSPGELETTTDKDGAFIFKDLEPGVYFLTASAKDHEKTQVSVTVEAGVKKPEIVRVMIQYIAPPVPTWQELTYKFSTIGSAWVNGVGGIVFFDPTGEGHFSHTFELDANTTWFQSELIWTAQTPLSETMRLHSNINGANMDAVGNRAVGTSPLLTVYESDVILDSGPLTQGNTMYVGGGDPVLVGVAVHQQATVYAHAFQNWVPPLDWRFSEDDSLRPPPP